MSLAPHLVVIGIGHVGSDVVTNAASLGFFSRISVIDADEHVRDGQALDNHQATGVLPAVTDVTAADYSACQDADAIIVADPAIMAYARDRHPDLRLHMSVQGSATNYEAINLMKDLFGIRRAVLPRVLTIFSGSSVAAPEGRFELPATSRSLSRISGELPTMVNAPPMTMAAAIGSSSRCIDCLSRARSVIMSSVNWCTTKSFGGRSSRCT